MKMVAGGAWAHNMSACTVFHQKTERIERPVLHPLKHCLPIISGLIYVTTTTATTPPPFGGLDLVCGT